MKILSITMRDGLMSGEYVFGDLTVIHSSRNSVGKTTLLRSILFALGYPIPATRGLNFNRVEFSIQVVCYNGKRVEISRIGDSIDLRDDRGSTRFSLPAEQSKLHQLIFGLTSHVVQENILGAFYIDQEKGWTLLNRGKAIGNIRFNLEELIRGLSDRSCQEDNLRLYAISRELTKYRQMFDLAKYQADIYARGENLAFDTPTDEIEKELNRLYCERQPVADEVRRLQNVICKNTTFKNYIASMQIRVHWKDGIEIPVTEETIVGFRDNVDLLATKKRVEAERLSNIDNRIAELKKKLQKDAALFDVQTSIQSFDMDVSRMTIDAESVRNIIRRLEQERDQLRIQIKQSVASNNPLVSELHGLISGYASELGLDAKYVRDIFTSDLKSLSGAIFHMIVFAFKIAYVRLIRVRTNCILPLLIDSPNGREVEKRHIDKMIAILSRDFSNHQIIIATIHQLELKNPTQIELEDGVMRLSSATQ